jgi:uncharacterized membrane protein (Fun14 family)
MVENKDEPDPVATAIDKLKPLATQISFGSIMGFCSGYALKKAGKAAAIVVGTGFIALQTASSYGYIKMDWKRISDDAVKRVDAVSDSLLFFGVLTVYILFNLGAICSVVVRWLLCPCQKRQRRNFGSKDSCTILFILDLNVTSCLSLLAQRFGPSIRMISDSFRLRFSASRPSIRFRTATGSSPPKI